MPTHTVSQRSPLSLRLALIPIVLLAIGCDNDVSDPMSPQPKLSLETSFVGTTTVIHDQNHTAVTTVPAGTGFHAKATVSGTNPVPTGTITFQWYFGGSCNTLSYTENVIALDANGEAETTAIISTPQMLAVDAVYSGDANYAPSVGNCAQVNASDKLVPNITLSMHEPAHAVLAQVPTTAVHPNTVVTGSGPIPTGTVMYQWFLSNVCLSSPAASTSFFSLNAAGIHDATTTWTLPAGTRAVLVTYGGDENYVGTTQCITFNVSNKPFAPVTIEPHNDVHQIVSSVASGASVHGKAIINNGLGVMPTGTVTAQMYGAPGCLGTPSSMTYTLIAGFPDYEMGTHFLTLPSGTGSMRVRYSGDVNYLEALSACVAIEFSNKLASTTTTESHDMIHQIATTLTGAINVHPKAIVTGAGPTPTGTVTFRRFDNGTCTGAPVGEAPPVSLNASGLIDYIGTTVIGGSGQQAWQAVYSGDGNYQPSLGTCAAYMRIVGLPPTIALAVHDPAHQSVTTISENSAAHAKVTVSGSGPVPSGMVSITYYQDGACTGPVAHWSSLLMLDPTGAVDYEQFLATEGLAGQVHAFRATYWGDAVYEGASAPCTPISFVADASVEPVTLGGNGYWKNWRNHYSPAQFQNLINFLKTNNAPVFNRDQVAGTSDDLTVAKLEAIYLFPKKPPVAQQVLAQFTSLMLDVALTQIAQQAGLAQHNDAVCGAGTLDVSGIAGASALLGTSSPTVAQVVAFVAQRWNGTLTANRDDWSFSIANGNPNTLLAVLSGINDGSIITTAGC